MRRVAALSVVIALPLSGCGGGGDTVTADEEQPDSASAVEEQGDSEVTRDSEVAGDVEVAGDAEGQAEPSDDATDDETVDEQDRWMQTPLAQYMGWGQSSEEDEAFYQEQDRQRQEIVSACMAEQGFVWVPVDYSQYEEFDQGMDPFEGLTEEERIDMYGFGWSTMFGFEEEMADQEPEFVDPNWELEKSMGDAEREAWQRALSGDPVEWDENDPRFDPTSEEFDPELMMPSGCWGEAERELGTLDNQEAQMVLASERESLYQRIENDPRMITVQNEWSTCMAESGYVFGTQDDMWRALEERMRPIGESQDPLAGMSRGEVEALFDSMTLEEEEEFFSQNRALSPEMEAELAEVQEFELGVARADFDCRKDLNIDDVWFEVQVEYEEEFIEEHSDLLEQIKKAEGR